MGISISLKHPKSSPTSHSGVRAGFYVVNDHNQSATSELSYANAVR